MFWPCPKLAITPVSCTLFRFSLKRESLWDRERVLWCVTTIGLSMYMDKLTPNVFRGHIRCDSSPNCCDVLNIVVVENIHIVAVAVVKVEVEVPGWIYCLSSCSGKVDLDNKWVSKRLLLTNCMGQWERRQENDSQRGSRYEKVSLPSEEILNFRVFKNRAADRCIFNWKLSRFMLKMVNNWKIDMKAYFCHSCTWCMGRLLWQEIRDPSKIIAIISN